jgi:hypothetical protein
VLSEVIMKKFHLFMELDIINLEDIIRSEIKELIEYAKQRNIEIMPEIDLPAHSWTLLEIMPELKRHKF